MTGADAQHNAFSPSGDDTRSVDTRTAGQRGRIELQQVYAELTALTASLEAQLDCSKGV
ncbi:MAG: hypothetical protein WC749_00675 [Dehalococcoidia bacterium]